MGTRLQQGIHRPTVTGTANAPAPPKPLPVFLNNEQAARYLNLSPRTLEKHRVIGGGPRFRKFALVDLEAWANARACDSTSDPQYVAIR
jgi:hypothetical protein